MSQKKQATDKKDSAPRYKQYQTDLRKIAGKWFVENGKEVTDTRPYCLKLHDSWKHNLLNKDLALHIAGIIDDRHEEGLRFPLHTWIHHGLSSQALCFNLFGPMMMKDDYSPLIKILKENDIEWPSGDIDVQFEYEDSDVFKETKGQPTSIDLAVSGDDKILLIEVKLSEIGFGGCSTFEEGNCTGQNPLLVDQEQCYLQKKGRNYWDKMKEFDFHKEKFSSGEICPFINYYQFFREVLFALSNPDSKTGIFILLYDKRNPAFVSTNGDDTHDLWSFLLKAIPEQHKNRVKRISIQDLVNAAYTIKGHQKWVEMFGKKYGLQL